MMNINLFTTISFILIGLTSGIGAAQTPVITGNPVTIQGKLKIVDGYAL